MIIVTMKVVFCVVCCLAWMSPCSGIFLKEGKQKCFMSFYIIAMTTIIVKQSSTSTSKTSATKLSEQLKDELAILNSEIDAIELENSYSAADLVNPDVRLDGIDFPAISIPKKKEWQYKITEKTAEVDNSPDAKLEGIELPLSHDGSDQEWSYRRIRDLITSLHAGLYDYAEKLSGYIAHSAAFKGKLAECNRRLAVTEHDLKNIIQDKVKLREALNDLTAKYNMLEHALKKAGDINEDNKQIIEKIRLHRDRCIQTVDNRNDVITSLRNQNAELRRHLASLRSRLG